MDSKGARRSENIRLKSARILAAQVPLDALHVQCAKCVTGSYLDVPRGLSPIRTLRPSFSHYIGVNEGSCSLTLSAMNMQTTNFKSASLKTLIA